MNIRIQDIRIRNYRSLKEVDLILDECTMLVGKNNCGKSNIIQAIGLAFSFTSISKEDVYTSPEEPYNDERKVIIDVRIVPIDGKGIVQDTFSDVWTRAIGDSVSIDDQTDKEYFAFRTEIKYDRDREIYSNNKRKIDTWTNIGEPRIGSVIKRETIENIDNISINAQRDISLDIKDRKSVWGKLTSKIKVSDSVRGKIEHQLEKLNRKIISESDILKLIGKELRVTTADRQSKVDISPITKDIESLYRGMNIYYTNIGSSPTSVDNLGLGIRSWAVFSTVKAEILSRSKKAKNDEFAYHPLILVEEPEAHVHPQAQRQLYSDINGIVGQKIITTHSPYIISQVELDKIRYVRKDGPFTLAYPLLIDGLDFDDIRKIRRTVMNTRGEILYANAVILAEGETEEQAITVYLREYFKKEPFELGINVIGVGGNNYTPFMRILDRLNIKWYVFSDGETRPLDDLKKCLKLLRNLERTPELSDFDNVFYLNDGNCFETYCLEQGYIREIKKAICDVENDPNYINYFINQYNNQMGKGGVIRNYKGDEDGGVYRAIKDCMIADKTKYPTAIAEEICKTKIKSRRIPLKLKEMFSKIELDLKVGES